MTGKIFMKVTNTDIANKIDRVIYSIQLIKEQNTREHGEIMIHQKETNGKVKLNELRSKTSLGLSTSIILILIGLLIRSIA